MNFLSKSFNRRLRKYLSSKWFVGVFVTLAVAMITVSLGRNVALLELTENYLADVRIALMSPPRPQSERIAIIVINDDTLAGYPYRSPLDRSLIASLVDEVEQRDALALGINVLFDRPTETDKDELLYQRLRSAQIPIVLSRLSSQAGFSALQMEYSRNYIDGLRSGLSFIYRDTVDNTIRIALLKLIQGRSVQLGFAATLAETLGLELPDKENMPIAFRPGPDIATPAFPIYLAHEVADLPADAFSGRVVLIGTDLGGDSGMRTPLDVIDSASTRNLPGIAIEAHVLSQLIEDRSLNYATASQAFVVILLMSAIGCLFSLARLRLWVKTLFSLLVIPIAWILIFTIYTYGGLLLPMVAPALAFAISLIISSFWLWRSEFQQRERIHRAFGQFLAPAIVEHILHNPEELELGGEVREVTFLFTDLEGFTPLSESTPPQQMVTLLNNYLEEACDIIIEHGGTVDKIIGDALHAMFNAPLLQPDHPRLAVNCALALDEWSEAFRRRMREKGIDLGVTRIGVNTGECVIGNFGGKKRFDYTAHGDTVNSTARLEAANKQLGTRICVSEATARHCDGIRFRPLANLLLPGKSKPITAYTPVVQDELDPTLHDCYAEAYELLSRNDPRAGDIFARLAEQYPDDTLVRLHLNRVEAREVNTTVVIDKK